MTTDIITVLAVVAGIVWLGLMLVSALRNRGGEEISPNLRPGVDDQHLETRRLESGQKVAIAASAFLAISLPLYFLGETNRQEGFVEEFSHASIERGEHLVEEFGCFDCHGPLGVGGSAAFVEPRSGVAVSWAAPALDDILYRYTPDEVNFWVTFGRGNTPMPGWGLDGGGPMNAAQVEDVVNYLATIQISQQEAVDRLPGKLDEQLTRLENGETTVQRAIIDQAQVLAVIDQAPEDADFIGPLAASGRAILDSAGDGIDTDADGLSDIAEQQLSEMSVAAFEFYREVDPIALDPEVADAGLAEEAVAVLTAAVEKDPALTFNLTAIEAIIAGDEITDENPDTDGDGLSDQAETQISGQMAEASTVTVPSAIGIVTFDPTNAESVTGVTDLESANTLVGGWESTSINTAVTVENVTRIRPQEQAGYEFLLMAEEAGAWTIDIEGVAASMGVSTEEAERAVALFNASCARCHTASFPAGTPYTLEVGSGGFGPALWDGRPVVQFGDAPTDPETEVDLLVDFIIKGSEEETPYGLNGFGSGRMPGFGAVLSQDDIELLAAYLRSGNLKGDG